MGELSDDHQSALVIVAHPDDETIWCGGFILARPDWDWTILSLCRADDADRAPKFGRVCDELRAKALISDLDDGNPLAEIDLDTAIGGRFRDLLDGGEWDLILTHGETGEYGHPRHLQTHAAVRAAVRRGDLWCREVLTFAYVCENPLGNCRPAPAAELTFALTPELLAAKQRLIHEIYGYGRDSFEVRACISPEAFNRYGS